MTLVIFDKLEIDERAVRFQLEFSRKIMHWNGNTTWNRNVHVITDDIGLAHQALNDRNQLIPRKAQDSYRGYCWMNNGNIVLWIKPRRDVRDLMRTLTHEVAHALCKTSHGHTWRRGFALLLPFWYRKFITHLTPEQIDASLINEISANVHQYATRLGKVQRLAEINDHLTAVQRALRRWDDTRDETGLHRVPGWHNAPTAQLHVATAAHKKISLSEVYRSTHV